MTVTVGYTTDDALSAYAIASGYVLSGDSAVNLQLALDWLELQPFVGEKTDPLQALEWPRDGDTVVPDKIVQAQLEAALPLSQQNTQFASMLFWRFACAPWGATTLTHGGDNCRIREIRGLQ